MLTELEIQIADAYSEYLQYLQEEMANAYYETLSSIDYLELYKQTT